MRSSRQPLPAGTTRPGPGALVRAARVAQGLSLAELGARVSYSASQISRYERGLTPLTNVTVLGRSRRRLESRRSASASSLLPAWRHDTPCPLNTGLRTLTGIPLVKGRKVRSPCDAAT
jgi:hypothetical protein